MVNLISRTSPLAIEIAFDLLDLPGTFDEADTEALVDLTGTTIGGVALGQCVRLETAISTLGPGDSTVRLYNIDNLQLDGRGVPIGGTLTDYVEYIQNSSKQLVSVVSTLTGLSVGAVQFALAATSVDPNAGQILFLEELAGADRFELSRFADYAASEAGEDSLYGLAGGDTLFGGAGDDLLSGGKGNDDLDGGADADVLKGGDGNDEVDGGIGNDILFGGFGADVFYFALLAGRDRILDFEDGEDLLYFGPGVTFEDLKITQRAVDTIIRHNDIVVFLKNLDSSLIDASDFLFDS